MADGLVFLVADAAGAPASASGGVRDLAALLSVRGAGPQGMAASAAASLAAAGTDALDAARAALGTNEGRAAFAASAASGLAAAAAVSNEAALAAAALPAAEAAALVLLLGLVARGAMKPGEGRDKLTEMMDALGAGAARAAAHSSFDPLGLGKDALTSERGDTTPPKKT